jgi:hypothetical protein
LSGATLNACFANLRRVGVRCAGVVRLPVVLSAFVDGVIRVLVVRSARRAEPDRMRSVVQIAARYAGRGSVWHVLQMAGWSCGVVHCRCGRLLLSSFYIGSLARRTRRCSGRAQRDEIGAILERRFRAACHADPGCAPLMGKPLDGIHTPSMLKGYPISILIHA